MGLFASLSDDFYVNLNLNTEMDLPDNRETLLHFFERIQKQYPEMTNFYSREPSEYVLEESKEQGHYRWTTVDSRRICAGHVNPTDVNQAIELHSLILDLVPYHLSISRLDCESLNLMYGFDFNYAGNHNELVADALGVPPAFERLVERYRDQTVAFEPHLQFSIDADCKTQIRISVETRTTAYHLKTSNFPPEQLSVYVTARRYGSLEPDTEFSSMLADLNEVCTDVTQEYVVADILKPLQRTIEIRSAQG